MCSIAIVCRKSQEIRREASSGSWVSQIQIFYICAPLHSCTFVPILICIFLQLYFCSVTLEFFYRTQVSLGSDLCIPDICPFFSTSTISE